MPKPTTGNSIVGTPGPDYLDDIVGFSADYTVDGRAGNDTIFGGNGRDTLLGGRGDDLIYASVEDLKIDGGAGVDTVSFLNSATGVRVELWEGGLGLWPDTNPTTVRSRVLSNVENIDGSTHDDFIVGSRAVNHLDGGGGNDQLHAFGSGDFLTGGADADLFQVSNVVGAADSAKPGTHTVTLTDFDYAEGDRIDAGDATPAQLQWTSGSANDADGNSVAAWIGTWDIPSGSTFELIVLGTDAPSNAWFV